MPDLAERALAVYREREAARRQQEAERAANAEVSRISMARRRAQRLSELLDTHLDLDPEYRVATAGRVEFGLGDPTSVVGRCLGCGAMTEPERINIPDVTTVPSREDLLERVGHAVAAVPCTCGEEQDKPRQASPGGRRTGTKEIRESQ